MTQTPNYSLIIRTDRSLTKAVTQMTYDREAVKSARQLDGEFASDDVPSHPPFARSVKIYAFLLYNGVRVGKAVVTYGMLIVNSKKDIHT